MKEMEEYEKKKKKLEMCSSLLRSAMVNTGVDVNMLHLFWKVQHVNVDF